MKKKFAILLALFLIAVVCSAGCIDPEDPVDPIDPVDPVDPVDPITPADPVDPVVPTEEYSVMFMLNYDDAGAYTAETVKAGETVSKPANPTRSGYTFNGWFTAAEGGAAYDFTQPVNADVTLYAQWKKKSSSSSGGHSHSYSWNVVKAANCTVDGQGQYVCSCGQVKSTETIPATGHLETEEVVNAVGDTEVKCKACGFVLVTIPASNELEIRTVEDLKAFADTVNAGTDYAGKTVKLVYDLNLQNEEWIPIGSSGNLFAGTFDGNGKTILNLKITGTEDVGFFGVLYGTVKNLNLDGVTITGNKNLGAIVGYGKGGSVEGCTVTNAEITAIPNAYESSFDNGDDVGGIVGFCYNGNDGDFDVSGCTVSDSTLTAFRDVGGIVGSANGDDVSGNSISNVDIIVDKVTNKYDRSDINGAAVVGRVLSGELVAQGTVSEWTVTIKLDGFVATEDDEKTSVEISTAEGMIFAASSSNPYGAWGAAGTGSQTYALVENIDMTEKAWTPVSIDGYHGAGVFTLEGNGVTIKGLTSPLFAGGFAGDSGIVIKNLTIADSQISGTTPQGTGAFISCADSMGVITLINCHLRDSTVTGGLEDDKEGRTGGLIGWTSGYSNQNDGPVKTYVTITDCSVIGCTITGSAVGGINGHAGASDWTYTTIANCVVKDNTLTSTDDGGWRVGVVVGTANVGEVTINDITESGNTLVQTGKTAPVGQSSLYGRFVPGTTGKLVIDGITHLPPVTVTPADGQTTQEALNAALSAASTDANTVTTINLPADTYTFPATSFKEGVTLVCEEGTVFEGNSKANIKGATVIGATFSHPSGTAVDQTINGVFKDCTFTGSNGLRWCYAGETVVFENCVFSGDVYGVHFDGGANDIKFVDCTFSGFNAFGGAVTQLTLENCTFKSNGLSGYNGVNLWGSTTMTGCTFIFDGTTIEWIDLRGDGKTGTFTNCVISDGTTERALVLSDVGNYGTGNTITISP